MFASAGAWLAKTALMQSPLGGFLKSIPRWLWITLAIGLAFIAALIWHGGKVKAFGQAQFAAGEAAADERHTKRAKAWAKQINGIAGKVRSKNYETNRAIAGDADALRLHGPGKATCLDTYGAIGAASGHVPPGRPGDAPVAPLPDRERPALIALPFASAIAFAEQCDLNRAEALSWREDKRLQMEAWDKAHPKE